MEKEDLGLPKALSVGHCRVQRGERYRLSAKASGKLLESNHRSSQGVQWLQLAVPDDAGNEESLENNSGGIGDFVFHCGTFAGCLAGYLSWQQFCVFCYRMHE